ncbi:hypothetical protein BC833DRAFT_572820, partial [Globomyces pollinis-pini]
MGGEAIHASQLKANNVHQLSLCTLCNKTLKDATAVKECLHTFCKSCIYDCFENNHACPTCNIALDGAHPENYLAADHVLQSIIHKILPNSNTIESKIQKHGMRVHHHSNLRPVAFQIKLDKIWLSKHNEIRIPSRLFEQLDKIGLLKTDISTTIRKLKKNLIRRLHNVKMIDLFCSEVRLGDEWTMEYVIKTCWASNGPVELYIRMEV